MPWCRPKRKLPWSACPGVESRCLEPIPGVWNPLSSEWVTTEIRKARKAELAEKRRKLFPIRLVKFEAIREWECFDADSRKDLATEIREYFVPDFSKWKDQDSFEGALFAAARRLQGKEPIWKSA